MDTKLPTKNADEFADELFETCSLAEIENLQNKLKKDVERKADQLKSLVSEKYRDLIDAADTISKMSTIVCDIGCIVDDIMKTKKINHIITTESQDKTLDEFAVLTRLLIDISEQIWDNLDKKNYLTATELFKFSSFIKKCLDNFVTNGFNRAIPFIEQIWSNLSHFKSTITEKVKLELSNPIIPEDAAYCFISLSMLENLNVQSLLKEFIVLRSNMLQHILLNGCSTDKSIESSAHLIINTIYNLFMCFTNNNQSHDDSGIVYLKIKNIFKNDKNILSLVNLDYSLKFGLIHLPKYVQEFRIDYILLNNDVCLDYITNIINNWLEWSRPFVCTKVSDILKQDTSLETLCHLNKYSIEYPQYWTTITENIKGCESNLWSELYCPIFSQRTKDLLSKQWEDNFSAIVSDINNYLIKSEETPLRENIFFDTNEYIETRSIGCSDKSADLCKCFENRIFSLTNMLNKYYPEDEDPWEFHNHQGFCCNKLIKNLVDYLLNVVEENKLSEDNMLLIARFSWYIPMLCPKLKHCLVSSYSQFNFWISSKDSIQNASIIAWNKWSDIVVDRIFVGLQGHFLPITLGEQLSTIPKWETIDIEVEKESGELIISKLYIPNQPSFPLQKIIFGIITHIAVILPPRLIHENLISSCINWILEEYKSNFEVETSLKSKYQIQKLFDLKYISMLFISVENEALSSKCSQIIVDIENQIDPINLDAINEYIVKNVKRAVTTTKCIFGTSLPSQSAIEFSDEANNMMFSTYRFKLFLVTDT
ncbi:conserved oligomeric Golgi complex subunit 1 isoform X2 [Daktulosphaira vitifoliae]|uniref:conserved oligomeric Golgi complex subunit 1 isoform X2 n=1 Tax=Daktulosphaira vitifoliae TaxID=58002 RepID=UPI0021A9DF31|nr:conserved oligomeric Golgi complex subunit 1 isoform X2 [Daktulosphaira vitifoliae]